MSVIRCTHFSLQLVGEITFVQSRVALEFPRNELQHEVSVALSE